MGVGGQARLGGRESDSVEYVLQRKKEEERAGEADIKG